MLDAGDVGFQPICRSWCEWTSDPWKSGNPCIQRFVSGRQDISLLSCWKSIQKQKNTNYGSVISVHVFFLCEQCCLVLKNIFYIPCDRLFKLFFLIWKFSCPCLQFCCTISFLGRFRLVYTTYICRLSAVYPPRANCQVPLELADALW